MNMTIEKIISIFLCGDVMLGRGIDQILPHPGDPRIYEPYMKSAKGYVDIAEDKNGEIDKPVDYSYVWGDALKEFDNKKPDLKIINLETSVTSSRDYWKHKGIHYKLNPQNINVIKDAGIDFTSLANNHVLDWGYKGLDETIKTLSDAKIKFAGAGIDKSLAEKVAVFDLKRKGRVLIYSCGSITSGIPNEWSAESNRAGVNLIPDYSINTVRNIKEKFDAIRGKNDISIVSIHWGSNWGYRISKAHMEFAHNLIDLAGVNIVHGHSSHHPIGIEVYKNRLILYGCGDFINDYEGITGYEIYRDDLALMYFVDFDTDMGKISKLKIIPMQIKNFKLNYAGRNYAKWIKHVLNREGKAFDTEFKLLSDNSIELIIN
ncbi:poly-gamma-glutamate synthesis protein (capsule biosynthesis protein) [Methanosarcina horonobensis HB-1 = JCM 15518]|uniref:Poly-gamma-glutamate synthesis protein (Capsule biosynthesis protein) n=2 Tax=Methanosarcina horonobensis TaxID=418008 RepID=A0A0E3SD75_9EURY|nr:poly-gamma-glutamate synthesis protein (capsule biosynthesis protein) [Methanosarcina horonobensis HB-1 = JCM 15518]